MATLPVHYQKEFSSWNPANADSLISLELPHRRIENWKYTNLNKLFENDYSFANAKGQDVQFSTDSNFYHCYFVNGKLLKLDKEVEAILSISDIESAKATAHPYFEQDFIRIIGEAGRKLGKKIEFSKNSSLDKPIFFHHLFSGEMSLHNYHSEIIVHDGCKLSVLEEIKSLDDSIVNFLSHVTTENNSQFEHTMIQDGAKSASTFIHVDGVAKRDSYYKNHIIHIGSKISRSNIYMELIGENATIDANGLYILENDQHSDTMSYIKHKSSRSYSNQLYKGILDDSSRGVFSGIIRIDQDAQEVDSKQLNKNLILSKKAQVNSRPQLEIYADDVKCAHGSTTGQLSEDEVFYFQSRGISPEKARTILARAFSFDVILKIENLNVQNYLKQKLITENKVK